MGVRGLRGSLGGFIEHLPRLWRVDLLQLRDLTLPGKPPLPPPPLPPPLPAGVRMAAADMDIGQFQDLADPLGEVKKAAAEFDLNMQFQIELSGGKSVPQAVVGRINELLAQVSSSLKMH